MADVEAAAERKAFRRRSRPFELEDGIEPVAGDRERRVVELGAGEGDRPGKCPIAARSRGATAGERKVELAAEIPAGEARRNKRRGDHPERRDVEAPAFKAELGGGVIPQTVLARKPQGREAGQHGFERGQDAGLADEVERPLGREGGVFEGYLLALGGVVGQAGKPAVEQGDVRARFGGRADEMDVGAGNSQSV